MKILYINHPEADYCGAFTYMGLKAIVDTVVDFPPKLSYRGQTHTYPSPYFPGSSGSGSFWADFKTWEGQKQGVTGQYEFMPDYSNDNPIWSIERISDEIETFDLIVMESPRCWVSATMCYLGELGKKLPPCVLIDGEDNYFIRFDYIETFRPSVYFKRECLPQEQYGEVPCKIVPFPLSSYVDQSKFAEEAKEWRNLEKEWDLVCLVGETHEYRREIIGYIKTLAKKYKVKLGLNSPERVNQKDHLKLLAQAKIGLSIRGWGEDTVRYWEIPSFNTLLLSDTLNIIRPDPFIESETASFYTSPQNCIAVIEYWLNNDAVRKRVAQAGMKHCITNHSCVARARTLLEEAKNII